MQLVYVLMLQILPSMRGAVVYIHLRFVGQQQEFEEDARSGFHTRSQEFNVYRL